MAYRYKKKGKLHPHFLAQWRQYRDLSQEDLADLLGTSGATISRVESGQRPYSQDFLEAAAEALGCTPADILSRDPRDQRGPVERAIELLQNSRP